MIGTTVISSWADEFNTRLRSVSELFILGGASLAGIESYQGQHVNELPRAAVQLNRMGYICMALATIGQGKGEETLNLRGIMSSMKSCLRIGLIEDLICKWGAAGESSRSIKLVALMASIAGFYFFKIGALISWINFFNPLNHLHSIRRAMHEEPIE